MKTEQQYLNEAKEEVALNNGFERWIELRLRGADRVWYESAALLALQKQRDDMKIELEKLFDEAGGTLSSHFTMTKLFRNS